MDKYDELSYRVSQALTHHSIELSLLCDYLASKDPAFREQNAKLFEAIWERSGVSAVESMHETLTKPDS